VPDRQRRRKHLNFPVITVSAIKSGHGAEMIKMHWRKNVMNWREMKMRKRKSVPIVSIPALILALVLSGCGGASTGTDAGSDDAEAAQTGGGEIVIGFVGAQTGASATMGNATMQGAQLAIEEINAAGGILGNQINCVIRDDEADPTKSKTAVEELVDKE
jgi:branched-chain amino acid transport system substrate-binding protein